MLDFEEDVIEDLTVAELPENEGKREYGEYADHLDRSQS